MLLYQKCYEKPEKDHDKMTEHELRTEIIRVRAERNRLKKALQNVDKQEIITQLCEMIREKLRYKRNQ